MRDPRIAIIDMLLPGLAPMEEKYGTALYIATGTEDDILLVTEGGTQHVLASASEISDLTYRDKFNPRIHAALGGCV